jgi:hypothetical protein
MDAKRKLQKCWILSELRQKIWFWSAILDLTAIFDSFEKICSWFMLFRAVNRYRFFGIDTFETESILGFETFDTFDTDKEKRFFIFIFIQSSFLNYNYKDLPLLMLFCICIDKMWTWKWYGIQCIIIHTATQLSDIVTSSWKTPFRLNASTWTDLGL